MCNERQIYTRQQEVNMSNRKETIITLAIATSLLDAEGNRSGGKYKREKEKLWAIVDAESVLMPNSFTRSVKKHVARNSEIIDSFDDKNRGYIHTVILDMLAKVLVSWQDRPEEKYNLYATEIEKVINKLTYWWTQAFECDIKEVEKVNDKMIENVS